MSQLLTTREEVIQTLVTKWGLKAESFQNNERTKSNEKFWTYNRLRNYLSKLESDFIRTEFGLQRIAHNGKSL